MLVCFFFSRIFSFSFFRHIFFLCFFLSFVIRAERSRKALTRRGEMAERDACGGGGWMMRDVACLSRFYSFSGYGWLGKLLASVYKFLLVSTNLRLRGRKEQNLVGRLAREGSERPKANRDTRFSDFVGLSKIPLSILLFPLFPLFLHF